MATIDESPGLAGKNPRPADQRQAQHAIACRRLAGYARAVGVGPQNILERKRDGALPSLPTAHGARRQRRLCPDRLQPWLAPQASWKSH